MNDIFDLINYLCVKSFYIRIKRITIQFRNKTYTNHIIVSIHIKKNYQNLGSPCFKNYKLLHQVYNPLLIHYYTSNLNKNYDLVYQVYNPLLIHYYTSNLNKNYDLVYQVYNPLLIHYYTSNLNKNYDLVCPVYNSSL